LFQETAMTDPSDILAADNEPCDWEAKRAAQDQLHNELQPLNKTALFDALAGARVTHVIVTFDGYGDSGQIENVEVKAGDTIVAMPEATIEVAEAVWGQPEPGRTTISIADEIERLVYDLLTDTHCGWWSRDETPCPVAGAGFLIPLAEPDVRVSKHPALHARPGSRVALT